MKHKYPVMRVLLDSAERVQWIRDLIALGTGDAATRIAAFALSAIVVRELGIVALGALTVAQAIVWYGLVFGDAGLSTDAVRRLAAGEPNSGELIVRTTIVQAAISLAATTVLLFLPFCFSFSRDVKISLIILSVTPVLYALNLGYVLQARKRLSQYARIRAFGQITGSVCGIASVFVYHSLSLVAASIVLGSLITDIAILWLIRDEYISSLRISHIHHLWSRLLEGRGYLLYAIANHLMSSTPVLGTAIISGAVVVGYFSIAQRMLTIAIAPSLLLSTASLPRFSRVVAVSGTMASRAQMKRVAAFVLPIVAAASSALVVFSHDIVTLLFGDGASAAASATAIMSVFVPISYMGLILATGLLAENRPFTQFWVTMIGALLLVVFMLALTPFLGGRGTVIAMIVSEAATCGLMSYLLGIQKNYLARVIVNTAVAAFIPVFVVLTFQHLASSLFVDVLSWTLALVVIAVWNASKSKMT